MRQALIVVDVQNDFCSGGTLAVTDADSVVPVLNQWLMRFQTEHQPIALTQDFHPANHCSFVDQGGPWPPHCVQGTTGCAFHPALAIPTGAVVFQKGTNPHQDAYSGFEGKTRSGQGLTSWLRQQQVEELVVGGLATDYCVRATVLDALHLGFSVRVCVAGIRGVEVLRGDSKRALAAMVSCGAQLS
jgi:nicotinamidase/pyrazinamidase